MRPSPYVCLNGFSLVHPLQHLHLHTEWEIQHFEAHFTRTKSTTSHV